MGVFIKKKKDKDITSTYFYNNKEGKGCDKENQGWKGEPTAMKEWRNDRSSTRRKPYTGGVGTEASDEIQMR